jgi:hypothetical protein
VWAEQRRHNKQKTKGHGPGGDPVGAASEPFGGRALGATPAWRPGLGAVAGRRARPWLRARAGPRWQIIGCDCRECLLVPSLSDLGAAVAGVAGDRDGPPVGRAARRQGAALASDPLDRTPTLDPLAHVLYLGPPRTAHRT